MRVLYRFLALALTPLLPVCLMWRAWRGKEDPARLGERRGAASLPRPDGVLVWLHAASVGECVSAMVLAKAMIEAQTGSGPGKSGPGKSKPMTVLLTSGTVISAEMVARRWPEFGAEGRLLHQFVPMDSPFFVKRFLDHWRPDLMILVEGDIWPNMLTQAKARGVPIALASAQISPSSLRFWGGLGRSMARSLFGLFELVLTVDEDNAGHFRSLPVRNGVVSVGGSMKIAAPALPGAPEVEGTIAAGADGRLVVALLSSHDGEEALFIEAIRKLEQGRFLAVIAPRHPIRGPAIQKLVEDYNETAALRSSGIPPGEGDLFWIADRMGEMGGIIRASDILVLGGGFEPLGGHNPMEPAALGKSVISGRQVFKNKVAFSLLEQHEGVTYAENETELADSIATLASAPSRSQQLDQGAYNASRALASQASTAAEQLLGLMR